MAYFKQFIKKEEGVETMEWIAIIAVTAVLIAACAGIARVLKDRMKGISNKV